MTWWVPRSALRSELKANSVSGGIPAGTSTIRTNLVEYFPLETLVGLKGTTLTASGATQTTGKNGQGYSFTRASAHSLACDDSSTVSTGDIDFWVCAWIKPATVPSAVMAVVAQWQNTVSHGYHLRVSSANVAAFLVGDGSTSTIGTATHGTTLEAGSWYFLVGYHSATSNLVGISLNGGAFTTAATSGAAGDSSAKLALGAAQAGGGGLTLHNFDGVIDGVGLWKGEVPTSDQVSYLYHGGNGRQLDRTGYA